MHLRISPIQKKKESVKRQLNFLIGLDYIFIHVNSGKNPKTIIKEVYGMLGQTYDPNGNIFDNKLIVIDEVHNFMTSVRNDTSTRKPFYELIMKAKNIRIVALSGTPVVKEPLELAYLFNMLHGRNTLYTGHINQQLNPGEKDKLKDRMNNIPEIDQWSFNEEENQIRFTIYQKFNDLIPSTHPSGVGIQITKEVTEKDIVKSIEEKIRQAFINKPGQKIKFKEFQDQELFPTNEKLFKDYYVKFNKHKGRFMINNIADFQKKIMGMVSYYEPPSIKGSNKLKDGYPTKVEHQVKLTMTPHQLDTYKRVRDHEIQGEIRRRANVDGDSKSTFMMESRQICNVAFPNTDIPKKTMNKNNKMDDNPEYIEFLKEQYPKILKPDQLEKHSPKFHAIINNLTTGPGSNGSSFVYSEFRKSSGGIMSFGAAPENNGWHEFKIRKFRGKRGGAGPELKGDDKKDDDDDDLPDKKPSDDDSDDDLEDPNDFEYDVSYDPSKLNYAVYPDKGDNRTLIHHIFNSDFDNLPLKLVEQLEHINSTYQDTTYIKTTLNHEKNLKGNIIKTLLVTQNVSEGISFFNVQQVHIMEPCWKNAIINQTIARAIRFESHKNGRLAKNGKPAKPGNRVGDVFPNENNQQVHVYKYMAKIPSEKGNIDLGGVGKYDTKKINNVEVVLSADDKVLDSAMTKEKLCKQFEPILKSASIDCGVINGEAGLCFSYGINTNKTEYAMNLDDQFAVKDELPIENNYDNEVERRTASFSTFDYKGQKLACLNGESVENYPEGSMRVFRMNDFIRSRGELGDLVEVGILVNNVLVPSTNKWKYTMGK